MQATHASELVTIASRDGTRIGLWRSGSGPSLLAVHGTAADHTAWDRMVPLLADSFAVYVMDRRGRGASGDSAEYSIEREFEDVAAAVDALPGPVILYGHSFGASCAAEASLRTSNLGRLILYEGMVKPAGLDLLMVPAELISHLDSLIQAGRREEALSTFMLKAGAVTEEELPILRAQPAWRARVAAAHTITRELRAIEAYSTDWIRFANVGAPTLLVAGSETEPRRREMFETLGRAFPNSRFALLPGQRHAAHQTAPEILAGALREFLPEDASAQENGRLIRRLFETFGRRQLDRAIALFADDAVFRAPGNNRISGVYSGHAGVLEFWRRQIDFSGGSLRTQPLAFESRGDRVAVEVLMSGERSGAAVSWRRHVEYRVVGGKIVEALYEERDPQAADALFGRGATS